MGAGAGAGAEADEDAGTAKKFVEAAGYADCEAVAAALAAVGEATPNPFGKFRFWRDDENTADAIARVLLTFSPISSMDGDRCTVCGMKLEYPRTSLLGVVPLPALAAAAIALVLATKFANVGCSLMTTAGSSLASRLAVLI